MSAYNSSGQINLTSVNGSTYTGRYASDGSTYIVINDGTQLTGFNHPCGAVNAVVTTSPSSFQHPNGSMYVVNTIDGYHPVTPGNPVSLGGGAIAYSTTAVLGTFALVGQTANSLRKVNLIADAGAFTLSGESMTPVSGYGMGADVGTFALAGQNVTSTRSLSAEAQAVIAAMTTPPDSARATLIDNLILGLKSDGIWSKLDSIQIYAAADSQAARVDWVLPSRVATLTNSPTFTTDRGFTTNGTSNYVDTLYNPSTGTNFLQNTCFFGVWSRTTGSITTSGSGWFDGTRGITINPRNISALGYRMTSATATTTTTPAITDGVGWFSTNRDTSTTTQAYRNGSAVTGGTIGTSGAIANHTLWMGAITAASFQAREWAAMAAGGHLTSTEHANLYTRIQTYMTAVGA